MEKTSAASIWSVLFPGKNHSQLAEVPINQLEKGETPKGQKIAFARDTATGVALHWACNCRKGHIFCILVSGFVERDPVTKGTDWLGSTQLVGMLFAQNKWYFFCNLGAILQEGRGEWQENAKLCAFKSLPTSGYPFYLQDYLIEKDSPTVELPNLFCKIRGSIMLLTKK